MFHSDRRASTQKVRFRNFLHKPIDNCFIINYFTAGLRFAANVDLQPVFNHHKCIIYLCSYFTKNETECSQAIIIVGKRKEAKDTNMNT